MTRDRPTKAEVIKNCWSFQKENTKLFTENQRLRSAIERVQYELWQIRLYYRDEKPSLITSLLDIEQNLDKVLEDEKP